MRQSILPLAALAALALLLPLLVLVGCKGKEKPKADESKSFSEQQYHPGLEGAQSIPGKALAKAEASVCADQLRQVRQSIRMDVDQGGQPPATLDKGATASICRCPISGKPYGYDAPTGKVWCTTLGHEKF